MRIPSQEIFSILAALEGDVGLYVEDLQTKETFTINPDRVFPAASVIKIPLLALLLEDVREGRVDLERPARVAPENRVGGTGILCELPEDLSLPLSAYAKLMIVLSDNIATNTVIDAVGMDRLNAFCRERDRPGTRLQRKMMDFDAIARGLNNYTSAADVGKMLSLLGEGKWATPEVSAAIVDTLVAQQLRSKLPALIPAVPVSPATENRLVPPAGKVYVAHKTGELPGVQHDVGIFTLPDRRRYVVAMLTAGLSEDRAGIEAIGKVSLAVYRAMQPQG